MLHYVSVQTDILSCFMCIGQNKLLAECQSIREAGIQSAQSKMAEKVNHEVITVVPVFIISGKKKRI